jgi:hypothetical protein
MTSAERTSPLAPLPSGEGKKREQFMQVVLTGEFWITFASFRSRSRILNRARNARCKRTLTFILSLTGRGEEQRAGLAKISRVGI